MISVKARINLKLGKVSKDVKEAVKRGMTKAGLEVERKAQRYAPYKFGQLTASIKTSKVDEKGDSLSISIGPTVKHGLYMERPGGLGVKSRAKGARRPYLKPALTESVSKIKQHIINEVRKVA